jgi:adenylyltransferase/sulfurtransferase
MESKEDQSTLSNDEYMRYSRQLLMKDIGIDG